MLVLKWLESAAVLRNGTGTLCAHALQRGLRQARRPAARLNAGSRFGSPCSARPFCPAAVAHLGRSSVVPPPPSCRQVRSRKGRLDAKPDRVLIL